MNNETTFAHGTCCHILRNDRREDPALHTRPTNTRLGSDMIFKFNNLIYPFPATPGPDRFYYYDCPAEGSDPGAYELYFKWQAPDGKRIYINIDLSKSRTDATRYELAKENVYWYFEAELEEQDYCIDLYAHNDNLGHSTSSIADGRIHMQHLGGGRFRLEAECTGKNGDTFSIDFEGTLAKKE